MPIAYPATWESSDSAVIVGSEPLDVDDATYVEVVETIDTPEVDELLVTFTAVPTAATAVPFVRFSTSSDIVSVNPGYDEPEGGYSEERFGIHAFDEPTNGDWFMAWEGATPVNFDGTSLGIIAYDLGVWPTSDFIETGNNGEWLTYNNQSIDADTQLDDWRPGLLTQFRAGTLIMRVRRYNDAIFDREERVIRVYELGIVYTVAVPSGSGVGEPRRHFFPKRI